MFNPIIDVPNREWCYGGKTTKVIGKLFMPEPVQVAFNGAIYTSQAELAYHSKRMLLPRFERDGQIYLSSDAKSFYVKVFV